jgi:hypothetical protein
MSYARAAGLLFLGVLVLTLWFNPASPLSAEGKSASLTEEGALSRINSSKFFCLFIKGDTEMVWKLARHYDLGHSEMYHSGSRKIRKENTAHVLSIHEDENITVGMLREFRNFGTVYTVEFTPIGE